MAKSTQEKLDDVTEWVPVVPADVEAPVVDINEKDAIHSAPSADSHVEDEKNSKSKAVDDIEKIHASDDSLSNSVTASAANSLKFATVEEGDAIPVIPAGKASELTGSTEVKMVNGHPVIRSGMDVSRFIVSTRDDGDPSVTFRGLVLGTIFTAFSSFITIIYQFKPIGSSVSAIFLMLLTWVFGVGWAKLTPKPERISSNPSVQTVFRFLNFGQPFLIKEHVVASLIASSGNNGLSGVEIYAVERLFYGRTVTATTALLGTFSLTLCGFVVAGVLRSFIVYPSEAVYWSSLPQVVLFQEMHFNSKDNHKRMKRFGWTFLGAAIWEFFPAYIAPWFNGLSVFCLASMGAPDATRTIITHIFGGGSANEGLGLLNFTLDWQYITSTAMSFPLKMQANSWVGLALFYILVPALYYGNALGTNNLPFMSSSLFTEAGKKFSVTSVFGQGTLVIDTDKLNETGIPKLTAATIVGYWSQTMAIGALIVHVLIFYSRDIWTAIKQSRTRTQPDPHYQAMLKYKEVPMWWYGATFLLAFIAGIVVNAKGETTLPVWAFIVALIGGAVIAPFSCVLYALFGTSIGTNALFKMIGGALVVGRPLANLYFTSWGHQVILLAVNLAGWLKIGQYTKVSHRVMFFTQIYASLLGALFNYLAMTFIVNSQFDILVDPIGNNVWSGQTMQSLNTQAITWALAKDFYSLSGPYWLVPLGLLMGAALPVAHWLATKIWPRLKGVPITTPIIASYIGMYYVGATSAIWSSIVVGVVSQVVLRTRYPRWFNKYNYFLGAALDGGSQTIVFILSLAVYGVAGKVVPFPTWFGNPDQDNGSIDHCL